MPSSLGFAHQAGHLSRIHGKGRIHPSIGPFQGEVLIHLATEQVTQVGIVQMLMFAALARQMLVLFRITSWVQPALRAVRTAVSS